VGPRADLDGRGKSRPPSVFDPPTVQPVAYSLYRLRWPAPLTFSNFELNPCNISTFLYFFILYISHGLFHVLSPFCISHYGGKENPLTSFLPPL
jgi:hypothetical protein